MGKTLTEKEIAEIGYTTTSRKKAMDEWSKLTKEGRKRWTDFEDYYEEICWNEYSPEEQMFGHHY